MVLATTAGAHAAAVGSVGSGSVVVANRGGGTISVIDAASDDVVRTAPLPHAGAPAEPMYVAADPVSQRFFVGDRANDRVVAHESRSLEPVGEIAAGDGVFHISATPESRRLWVVNDTAQQISVLDMDTLSPLTSFDTPFATPHNIAVSADQSKLYLTDSGAQATQVSIFASTGPDGVPVLIDTVATDLNPFGVAAVGVTPVPVPAPLALLATGALGLAVMRAHRRRA